MKRVAILGAGSFLAKNFIKYSLDNQLNFEFYLYGHSDSNLETGFQYKKIDFGIMSDVKKIDFSADAIMVFIGKTGTTAGFDDYRNFIEVNEIMLLNILKAYVDAKSTARIIYPSSRLIFKSNEEKCIDENGERECKSIYAVTKQAAEEYLKIYKESFEVDSTILRICTPIGSLLNEFGNYGTFEIFKKQAIEKKEITVFGDGLQRKTFTSMQDICKAFSMLIEKNQVQYGDYNLGGQDLSLLEIAKSIADEYGIPIKHVPWPEIYKKVDGGSLVFDSTRFDREFGMTYTEIID